MIYGVSGKRDGNRNSLGLNLTLGMWPTVGTENVSPPMFFGTATAFTAAGTMLPGDIRFPVRYRLWFKVRFEVLDPLVVPEDGVRVGFRGPEALAHQAFGDGERFCRAPHPYARLAVDFAWLLPWHRNDRTQGPTKATRGSCL